MKHVSEALESNIQTSIDLKHICTEEEKNVNFFTEMFKSENIEGTSMSR